MKPSSRTRLASMAVLFLVLVTGFLLGMAWDRSDGILEADDAVDNVSTTGASGDRDADEDIDGRDEGERGDRDETERGGSERVADEADGGDDERRDRRLIVHRVGITPEQEARVDSIVDIHGDRVRELRRQMEAEYDSQFRRLRREREAAYNPRFEAVVMETRQSIRSLLTEEQAVRYDSLLAEHDRREAERERREAESKRDRR